MYKTQTLLLGTESDLDETALSSEVFPTQYTTYCHNRNRHSGGVFILVRSDVPSSLIHVSESIEQIWVHIHKQYKQSIILGCFPPNSPITVLDELQNIISEIRKFHPIAKLLLGGEFSSPVINWGGGIIKLYQTHMYQNLLGRNSLKWQKTPILSNQLPPLLGAPNPGSFLLVIQILSSHAKLLPVLVIMILDL